MLTLSTLTLLYKLLYTNKFSTTVYKLSYATTMNIFRVKKYNEKFEKEVKNKENKENITELFFIIDILMKSWHLKRKWKSLLKYVEFEFNFQTIVLSAIHDVFFDVTNSVKNWKITENNLKSCSENESETYKEVIMSDNFKQWKQAMNSEYKSLEANFTWDLVKLFFNWCALKNKWIFYYK